MIELNNVSLGYNKKPVLNNLDLYIGKGEFVGIIGLSGAGKSTLLMSLIGNIEILSGRYNVINYQLGKISKKHLNELRTQIGFIFQGYNLVDRLNVLHNTMSGMLGRIPLSRALIRWYDRQELVKGYESVMRPQPTTWTTFAVWENAGRKTTSILSGSPSLSRVPPLPSAKISPLL